MKINTIEWKNNKIRIIDQSKLPHRLKYIYIDDVKALWKAIKNMKIRGAPALGAASALGVYFALRESKASNTQRFYKELDKAIAYLASCRPTARNLFWGLESMRLAVLGKENLGVERLKRILFAQANKIIAEDKIACRKIGNYGARLIKNKDTILTICNAGILATIDYGTALAVIYRAQEEGKKIKVFACESRPMLQGARLTAWELKKNNIDVTLICDNTAATLMRQGKIDKVITGADRIAANADTANKIGTYNLAVLSRYHKIPFYIAAPETTFDLSIKTGKDIHIEERDEREVTELFFKKPIAPKGVKVFNPAFDITDHHLITGIITDKGIIRPPYLENIKKVISF